MSRNAAEPITQSIAPSGWIDRQSLRDLPIARSDRMSSISVVMATYNGERFIRDQLDSLAAQQYLPAELIISDDASSDGTVAIAEQFAKTAPFTVHIARHGHRVGYSANFMRGASLCTSDIIAFCDQDDIWSPQKLASCIEGFRNPAVLLVYHNAEVITETGELLDTLSCYASAPISPPLSLCPVRNIALALGFTEVFRRCITEFSDLWEMSLNFMDLMTPMAHDQWVFFIASVFGSIVYIDETLAAYRQHDTNLYGWRPAPNSFCNLSELFRNPAREFNILRHVAERCAEILERRRHSLPQMWQQRATMGAKQCRLLADLYAAREGLYTSPMLADRVRAFHLIVSRRGYQPKASWGVGRANWIRDFCIGLPAGHLL
jgi:glycosyltransferase involved in cell wall biosynthesis